MQTPSATSVEAVDLKDLVHFSCQFDPTSPNALRRLVEFSSSLMTEVEMTNLLARVETVRYGRARTPPTAAEAAAVGFFVEPSYKAAVVLLEACANQTGARVYRPELLHCCISALRAADGEGGFVGAAVQARERNRHM